MLALIGKALPRSPEHVSMLICSLVQHLPTTVLSPLSSTDLRWVELRVDELLELITLLACLLSRPMNRHNRSSGLPLEDEDGGMHNGGVGSTTGQEQMGLSW